MIDMSHNGHYRCTVYSLSFNLCSFDDLFFQGIFLQQFGYMPHFLNHNRSRLLIDHLVDGGHIPQAHK